MDGIRHRNIPSNGITMHIAEAGPDDGRTVVLCHGFPECWYSWRHQLVALGEAGFHAIAPDQRGYGLTDMPGDVGEYTQLHLVGDLVGLLDALDVEHAAIVGHDWGGPVAWHAALLRPDRFDAVAALSVHLGRHRAAPDAVDEADRRHARRARRRLSVHPVLPGARCRRERARPRPSSHASGASLYSLSGDIPRDEYRFFDPTAKRVFDTPCASRRARSPWLSDDDLDAFVDSFAHHGTFFGGLNWYRCIDRTTELMAPFAGRQITQPALFIGAEHDSIFGQTPEAVLATQRAHPEPAGADLGRRARVTGSNKRSPQRSTTR